MNDIHPVPKITGNQYNLPEKFPADEQKIISGKIKHVLRNLLNAQQVLTSLALICVLVLFSNLIESGFLAALCLFVVIFLMPLFSLELRQNKSILLGYFFVITLHETIAFANAYLFVTFGAGFDAALFQKLGGEFAMHEEWGLAIGPQLYAQMLGLVYRWLGVSHLLGEQLSILAFSISCIIFLKIIRLCGIVKYKIYSLLAFGALPTMVFLGSITLRESYQVLSFLLVMYFGIKMHMKGGINSYIIAFILSVLSMCVMLRGLIGYGMWVVPLFFIWSIRPVSRLGNVKILRLVVFVIGPISIAGLILLINVVPSLGAYNMIFDRSWLEFINTLRTGSINVSGRTTYGIPLDLSSNMMTIYSSLKLYVYYLFAPFPWQVSSVQDVYGVMESFFRMILIYFSVKHWCIAEGSQRRLFALLLIMFFSITLLFSIGTSNYGTAMRHHMLSWWIIVMVGTPLLMAKLSCIRFGAGNSGHRILLKPIENIS